MREAALHWPGSATCSSLLGQTMIQVRVPGLSASAYVTVRVMQDNSSKANPMVALGEDHTLALKADGTVWSWGSNDRGPWPVTTPTPS